MSVPFPILEIDLYHEAGHAAMFAYYRVPISYISIKPDPKDGYGGMVVIAAEPSSTDRHELEAWMRSAAAGRIAANHRQGLRVPANGEVLSILVAAEEDLAKTPDNPKHDDLRSFAILGLHRDELHSERLSEVGPASWVSIWLETESLIRGRLWPAVCALSDKLWAIADASTGKKIAEIPNLDGKEAAQVIWKTLGE